jgi:hypothetical protein
MPIAETSEAIKDLNETLRRLRASKRTTRERSLAITKVQEAIMWLGIDLAEEAVGR